MSTVLPAAKGVRGKNGNGVAKTATVQPAVMVPQNKRVMATAPTHEQIALRAYEIYEREGRKAGHEVENWLAAEAELRDLS